METITMCHGAAPTGAASIIFFRLEDGLQTFYHSTGIAAKPEEAERNQQLRDDKHPIRCTGEELPIITVKHP